MSAFCRVAFAFTAVLFAFHGFAQRSQNFSSHVGGEHIVLEVTDKGAKVDLDCVMAPSTSRILVATRDSIQRGRTSRESGPQREDQPAETGEFKRRTMTLTIMLSRVATVGPFSLTRGEYQN
jgi:hypothetical protein